MGKVCTDKGLNQGNGIITLLQLIRNRTQNANSIFEMDKNQNMQLHKY